LPQSSHLRIPNASQLTAAFLAAAILFGAARGILLNGQPPMLLPALAALLSVTALWAIKLGRDPLHSIARLGFHVGLFAYFIAMPLIYPERIEPGITESVHRTVGWMLVITLVGFETGYHSKNLLWRRSQAMQSRLELEGRNRRILGALLCAGLFAWFMTAVDYSIAARVSVWDILFSMRGRFDGATLSPLTQLGQWSYLLAGGLYLATAVSFLFVTSRSRLALPMTMACWAILLLCATLGFLSGSRALFLYCFAPLALAVWVVLSKIQFSKALRVALVVLAASVLVATWTFMSAIRAGDTPDYETAWENVKPVETARGAFDIYSSSAQIVEYFPDQIDYEYGRSLIPLALGWVPRSVWHDKPYPFSIYANVIRGETLEDRQASIAVGLPGEGYGNFGLVGALIWGALMGLACRFADDYLRKLHHEDSLRLYLGATICIWAAMIVRGGVPEMFYMGLQVSLFPLMLAAVLRTMRRRSHGFARKIWSSAGLRPGGAVYHEN
jgi:hypothetical protein